MQTTRDALTVTQAFFTVSPKSNAYHSIHYARLQTPKIAASPATWATFRAKATASWTTDKMLHKSLPLPVQLRFSKLILIAKNIKKTLLFVQSAPIDTTSALLKDSVYRLIPAARLGTKSKATVSLATLAILAMLTNIYAGLSLFPQQLVQATRIPSKNTA